MRKRLRKKLRLGEFTERGFAIGFVLLAQAGSDAALDIIDALLAQAIEPLALALYAGGDHVWSGFVTAMGRRSVTEDEKASVLAWLHSRLDIDHVRAGPLIDAWHSHEERFELKRDPLAGSPKG